MNQGTKPEMIWVALTLQGNNSELVMSQLSTGQFINLKIFASYDKDDSDVYPHPNHTIDAKVIGIYPYESHLGMGLCIHIRIEEASNPEYVKPGIYIIRLEHDFTSSEFVLHGKQAESRSSEAFKPEHILVNNYIPNLDLKPDSITSLFDMSLFPDMETIKQEWRISED